jgi:transcriptional regulator with XRE-family HTH domain
MDKASTGSLESFYKEVGNNVKRHRVRKKMTLEDLGFAVGLDRMNISRIEKGLNITLATILKLSLALNVKPHVLLKVNSANQVFELDALVSQNKASKIKEKPNEKPELLNKKYLEELFTAGDLKEIKKALGMLEKVVGKVGK